MISFFAGLGPNSRVKAKMIGLSVGMDTFLMAQQLDTLNLILWTKTQNAETGRNKPESIAKNFIIEEINKKNEVFDSSKDFEEMKRRILERSNYGTKRANAGECICKNCTNH